VRRFETILEYDKRGQGYAYESLAKHYAMTGDIERQQESLEKAYEVSRNPRYKLKLAEFRGDVPAVTQALGEMLERDPGNDAARARLLQILMTGDDTNRVIEVASEGIRYSPEDPYYPYCTGRALIAQGRIREGFSYFVRCEELNAPPDLLREIGIVLEELNRRLGIEQ
jgi:tetratricopeptide (TPR) repeat protein